MGSQPRFGSGIMAITCGSAIERSDECVPITIFRSGYRGFGFDHRVYAPN